MKQCFCTPNEKNKVEAAKFVDRMSETPTMRSINARANENVIRECEHLEFRSDDYWRCQARHYTMTIYHPTGTCKMGPDHDPHAVRSSFTFVWKNFYHPSSELSLFFFERAFFYCLRCK